MMAKKNTPKNPDALPETAPAANPATPAAPAPKSYVPTAMTGLQDYSYWWEYAREHANKPKPNSKTFRRGRIWA
ncbi:cyanobactin biosynthesis PatC/TenC/TruC family protein [Limnospira fusiformis KN01]|uniref:cyanobactin biosynthesis PatC/TenC/TruC family protein n=1 Tax=Limnospira TaxID=2596745 RepID=UPI001658A13A|nr:MULTISPECIES: cyanobactin biosynthesis PatC/TenC/TruC family protein [Limnospira]MDT9198721.1 cyanobactin biosynthesis PatC/TenC/TruC family protein [Limnospira sp. PMC 1042.18]QNH56066.1 MAG: cyanobactin biosynthesis PatC/TenC/TruC family protein [Limnospira indica BM01]ULB47181.1 cyanobactin biosynthesis PatC/TenC/TruC family protein [Limnospira fusiformis KN01]